MGVIDKNTVTLRCPSCGQTETLTAVEKGSVYGSSGWNDFNKSDHFIIESEENSIAGPHIVSAKCKKCSCDAIQEKSS